MRMIENKVIAGIVYHIIAFSLAVAVVGFFRRRYERIVLSRPEQREQVTLTGKRIKEYSDFPDDYLFVFKFPDHSKKEFILSGKECYDSFHEGDTGMLIYKEMQNIEDKKESIQCRYRHLMSFEKDEY